MYNWKQVVLIFDTFYQRDNLVITKFYKKVFSKNFALYTLVQVGVVVKLRKHHSDNVYVPSHHDGYIKSMP